MGKKPAKIGGRAKGRQDGSRPLRGKAAIVGDVCVGYTVVTDYQETKGKVVGGTEMGRYENLWDAIFRKKEINGG